MKAICYICAAGMITGCAPNQDIRKPVERDVGRYRAQA